jgi:hypothetical protein
MKDFHFPLDRLKEWRSKNKPKLDLALERKNSSLTSIPTSLVCEKCKNSQSLREHKSKINSSLSLILAIGSLTTAIGYRFYNQPKLAVGTLAPQTIQAPRDGSFEDRKTTLEKRLAIENGIVPVLTQSNEITERIKLKLTTRLQIIEQARQLTEPFPFFPNSYLSKDIQQYLRSCSQGEWQEIADRVTFSQKNSPTKIAIAQNSNPSERAIVELEKYFNTSSTSEWENAQTAINLARYRYAQANKTLLQNRELNFNEREIFYLLNLDRDNWQKNKQGIVQATERILTQGIPNGLSDNLLERAVLMQLESSVAANSVPLGYRLIDLVLEPNLSEDERATSLRAQQASLSVQPVIVEIQQGKTIVEKGQIISQEDFVLLDGFGLSRRGIDWQGLELALAIAAGSVTIFWLVERKVYPYIRKRDRLLLCLLALSSPLLAISNNPYNNLAAIGLLASSFYNPTLAITQVSLLAGIVTFTSDPITWEYILASTAGGLLAASFASKLRSREALARLGIGVGITQAGVYLLVKLIVSANAGAIFYAALPAALFCGLSGIAWVVLAIGLSPYFERIFDVITPIRLAELSNPNLPLLQKLATETPGTFQHTMFVASLAEAAARELNCNVELVRAGTLYHDIGKMHDPLGFIENQMGGPNKHDEINNPWVSATIIKKHVSEGLIMARKYGLPKAVRDFIPQHQGTLLISYFYFQAKQKSQLENQKVSEADFRYDGPIPQSRETGIMMLADACEAALRSLKEATPEIALLTIQKIFKARWRENQLVDSGLKWEELPKIAEVFISVWQQYNHQRIAYPNLALEPQTFKKS